jgi:hypothetical protein
VPDRFHTLSNATPIDQHCKNLNVSTRGLLLELGVVAQRTVTYFSYLRIRDQLTSEKPEKKGREVTTMKYEAPMLIALMPAINAVQGNHCKCRELYFEGVLLPYEQTDAAYQDYE